MHRRTLLRTVGAGALAVLAGCGDGGGGDGATPSPTTTEPPDTPTPTESPTETPTPTPTETQPDVAQVVDVGGDGFRFTPATFEIAVGDTVLWEWNGGGHNVVPDSTPDGSDWSGTEGGSGTTYDTGHAYEFTFEVAGEYTYFCAPHRSVGMTGAFTVTE